MRFEPGLRTLLAAIVVGLLMQTPVASAASQPVEPPDFTAPAEYKPIHVTVRPMGITLSGVPTPLNVGQQQHSAFPGMVQLPDGRVHLYWRRGRDHAESRDGVIERAVSVDGGRTFGPPVIIRADGDDRDPSPVVVDNVEYLTWFTGTNNAPAQGAFVMREWGQARRMDGGLPYAATAAPLVKLPNGLLGGAFYGRKPGENVDTAFVAWSWDGAWSWDTLRVANSIGAGIPHNEPWLVVDGAWTHVFYRDGGDGIAMRSSSNSLLPGSWQEPRRILNDATGRPSTFRTAAGSLIMMYRQASTGAARMAFSLDHGASWRDGGVILPSVGGIGTTYTTFVEPEPGKIRGVVGREGATGLSSQLYGFDLVES